MVISTPPASTSELPRLGTLPAFELVAQSGRPFGSRDLQGHVYIANFIFTRCPSICPRLSAQMAAVQGHTAASGDALRLVSFSVDPEYDTPERLLTYGEQYRADFQRWTFLTGSLERIQATVVGGMKVDMEGASPGKGADPMALLHGTRFVLVDRAGVIRGYYASDDPAQMQRLEQDAVQLAATRS